MSKITIIGSGRVGSTIAYSLTCRGLGSEIVIIDINGDRALGEAQEGLDDFACMRKLEQLSKQQIPAGLYALKDMPERFADVISCEEMEEYVIAGAREILK